MDDESKYISNYDENKISPTLHFSYWLKPLDTNQSRLNESTQGFLANEL